MAAAAAAVVVEVAAAVAAVVAAAAAVVAAVAAVVVVVAVAAVVVVAVAAVKVAATVADSDSDTVMTASRGYTHTNTSLDFALGHRPERQPDARKRRRPEVHFMRLLRQFHVGRKVNICSKRPSVHGIDPCKSGYLWSIQLPLLF